MKINECNATNIDTVLQNINGILSHAIEVADIRCSPPKCRTKSSKHKRPKHKKNWYDIECKLLKQELKRFGSLAHSDPFNNNLMYR